jgi:DNA-binding LacI/PurR family transcriptional regulator
MKPAGIYPSLQSALDYVESNLKEEAWKIGEWLPSIQRLSQLAGVSPGTMYKAVAVLRERGLVCGKKNHRIRVGSSDVPSKMPTESRPTWRRYREILEKDLAAGAFGLREGLPPLKVLQSRYVLCYRTIRKILNSMAADGLIRRSGKKFALPAVQTGAYRKKILFITLVGHFTQQSALNRKYYRIINLFENECVRAGLTLEIVEIDFSDTLKSRRAAAKLVTGDATIGFILDIWWYESESQQRSYIDMLTRLSATKRPVALLDEYGNFDLPLPFMANPLFQVYRFEGANAGTRMMKYLHAMGHRVVVYISILHFAPWSRNRFDGIAGVLADTRGEHRLHLVAQSIAMGLAEQLTVAGLTDSEIRKLLTVGLTESQADDLIKQWLEFKKSTRSREGIPGLDGTMHRNLSGLVALSKRNPDDFFFEKTLTGALDATAIRTFEECVRPLFVRALEHRDATAWICANDDLALTALSFLHEKRIGVPRQLSVVGFDNSPLEALEHRLTTFDFNAMGFIHGMLNFILRPPRPRGPYRHSAIEVEGVIMERATAGPAR